MSKYVLEVERNGRICLRVRVPGQHEKLFRPEDFGSPEELRKAAEDHAEMLLQAKERLPLQRSPKVGSKSGVPGVRKKTIRGVPYWIAEYNPEPHKPKRKVFSITKYGEEDALMMAIDQRTRWEHGEE